MSTGLERAFLGAGTAALWFVFAPGASAAPDKIDFSRDVRPILSENCFTCHGPDEAKRKSGLRLDNKDDAFKPAKSGETAIVPGQPEASELVKRVLAADEDEHMPPKKSGKTLKPEQIAVLKKWIAEGAEYRGNWAFIKPERPAVPEIRNPQSQIRNRTLSNLAADYSGSRYSCPVRFVDVA